MTINEIQTYAQSQPTLIVGVLIGLVLLGAFLGYLIGRGKDRPVLGVMLGGLLPVPGLVAISLMSRKEPEFY